MRIDLSTLLDALCLAAYSDSADTKMLLEQFIEIYKQMKTKNPDVIDQDMELFIHIIDDIIHAGVDLTRKAEVNQIILKIKKSPIAQRDSSIVDNVVEILKEDISQIKPDRINKLMRKISQWIMLAKAKQDAMQMLVKCNKYNPEDDAMNDVLINDVAEYARQLIALQDASMSKSETIDVVDMTDPDSLKKVMHVYKNRRVSSIFKTGLKQLNRMLGKNYGFLRGEFWAFAASSHNFKSGMLMKCARWFCTKSQITVPSGMTPCVVFISLENEIPENSMDMMREAYVDIYREPIPEDMPEDELIQKISEYYNQQNIKFMMYRFDENFGFSDFVKLQIQLKNKGYCVVASIIDYITLMQLEGDDKVNQAIRLQKLANHFANFAKRNDQLIVTGLQLNSSASELNASGKTNVVKLYKAFHLSDCKGVVRELDGLIFLYIEENQDGVPFLTGAWYKHRIGGESRPAKKCQYFAYRFHPILGLLEDEGTDQDFNREDIYTDELPSEEELTVLFGNNTPIAQQHVEENKPMTQPQEEYTFG